MKFGITEELTEDILEKFRNVANIIEPPLKEFLKNKDYGTGIESLYIDIICVHPKFDFFCTVRKKYTKSKKMIEYSVKLDHAIIVKSNKEQIQEILANAIIDSLDIITVLKIKDFDVERFRADLQLFFSKVDTFCALTPDNESSVNTETTKKKVKRDYVKMDIDAFWHIIDTAVNKSGGGVEKKMLLIRESLQHLTPEELIGFEITLRERIIEADHYNIMAAAKIIEGWVSDDSYLYFRCWLISKGRNCFENALKNADSIDKCITKDEVPDGEDLLSVASEVYEEKTEDEMDYSIFTDLGLDYDFTAPATKGEDWTEDDLPKLCPNLFKMFSK